MTHAHITPNDAKILHNAMSEVYSTIQELHLNDDANDDLFAILDTFGFVVDRIIEKVPEVKKKK